MVQLHFVAAGVLCLAQCVYAWIPGGRVEIKNYFEIMEAHEAENAALVGLVLRDVDPTTLYPVRTIQVPVDHFHNESRYEPHSNDTFALRYWFDPTFYKKGGPVIVLQAGETSGVGRLPYLQKGIAAQLAKATHGIGVILEHRYYGQSIPTPDFTVENLRFLTTEQGVADMAYFAQNVVYEGFENVNLTAATTPYIAYGGSYAGAMVAFLRKLYPDIYFGAIGSSAVTEAIYDFWQYYEATRIYGPPDCVETTQKLTHMFDNIAAENDPQTVQRLKNAFGMGSMTHMDDVAYIISWGPAWLQMVNWDPAVNAPFFDWYCANVSSNTLLYPDLATNATEAQALLTIGGYGDELGTLTTRFLNWIGYVNASHLVNSPCPSGSANQDACFSNRQSFFANTSTAMTWRPWTWQYCTEWGYLGTGSGVPANQLPLVPRLMSIEYLMLPCKQAFNITGPPDVDRINKYGGFDISYPHLAFINGERDVWRAATPHAIGLPPRENTVTEPFILIDNGVHHWDENGLFPNETTSQLPPQAVKDTQKAEADFVKEWLKEYHGCDGYGGYGKKTRKNKRALASPGEGGSG